MVSLLPRISREKDALLQDNYLISCYFVGQREKKSLQFVRQSAILNTGGDLYENEFGR